MYHYLDAITDTKGNALTGLFVKAVDTASGDVQDIFADANSTPIVSASGVANAAKINSDGMADFWVPSGTYHLDIYNIDALTLVRRESNCQLIEPLDQAAADARYVQITDYDQLVAGIGNNIISGCGVAYNGLLGFGLSAGTAYIDGTLVDVAAQTISLAAADATNPRIDVLYVDDTGTFGALTGDPAVQPSQPSVDATTQLFLTFVLVPAAATSLSGITTETIYDEGTEWTGTASGTGFTVNSTNNPNSGTKCIEATSLVAGSYVKLVRSAPESFDGDGNLLLSIRSKALWNSKRTINLRWRKSGVTVGSLVTIKDGSFGFNSGLTGGYQQLVIPKSLFAVPAGTLVDELRITALGTTGSAIGFYVDPIKLQNTGTTTGGPVTQTEADARYLKLTGGTLSGDLIVPDEAYGVGWDGSLEVPTKNAVYDKIEAVLVGAGSYTDENAQDAAASLIAAGTDTGLSVIYNDAGNALSVALDPSTGLTVLGGAPLVMTIEPVTGTTYTFAAADSYKHKRFTNGSAIVATIPKNATAAIPVGTRIRITQAGAGQITLTPEDGTVTVNSADSSLKSRVQFSVLEIEKVGTNEWDVLGDATA